MVTLLGRQVPRADLFRALGLLGFIAVLALIVWALWPQFADLFSQGGVSRMVARIRQAGPYGVLVVLGLQFLQVVVAFIPGEVVQMAAGVLYGPWFGALVILVGCCASSWVVYQVVHRLGQPFVEDMVPTKYLDRFREFERSGKLLPLVFVLFLIPGLPKDTFTYLVPLTSMPVREFLAVTTIARLPGVLMSTYAASGLMDGNIRQSIAMFAVVALLAVVGFVFKDKIMAFLKKAK